MDEYKPNSKKALKSSDKSKPVVKPVVQAVKRKKQSEIGKFMDVFLAMDVSQIKEHAIHQIIIPYGKKILMDTLDFALNGEVTNGKRGSTVSQYDYAGCFSSQKNKPKTRMPDKRYRYDEIILATARDAENCLKQMRNIIQEYDFVTVGMFFELVNECGRNTDYNYGWYDLDDVTYHPVRGGWVLDLPKPRPIEK